MSSATAETLLPLQNVAIFGTGQVGNALLKALLHPVIEGYKPKVYVFVLPGSRKKDALRELSNNLNIIEVDFAKGGPELAEKLTEIDAVVCTLSGEGLKLQYGILEAAVAAGGLMSVVTEVNYAHGFLCV